MPFVRLTLCSVLIIFLYCIVGSYGRNPSNAWNNEAVYKSNSIGDSNNCPITIRVNNSLKSSRVSIQLINQTKKDVSYLKVEWHIKNETDYGYMDILKKDSINRLIYGKNSITYLLGINQYRHTTKVEGNVTFVKFDDNTFWKGS